MSVGELENHLIKCNESTMKCSICLQNLKKSQYIANLSSNQLKYFNERAKIINEFLINPTEKIENVYKKDNPFLLKHLSLDNSNAWLGNTGKFYCRGYMTSECDCCSSECGPKDGCNCTSCMELDIQFRNLPKGWLVNRAGYASKRSPTDGKYFCGRRVNPDSVFFICKSTDQCSYCERLNKQIKNDGRYFKLV